MKLFWPKEEYREQEDAEHARKILETVRKINHLIMVENKEHCATFYHICD
jgi:hypothetical protein